MVRLCNQQAYLNPAGVFNEKLTFKPVWPKDAILNQSKPNITHVGVHTGGAAGSHCTMDASQSQWAEQNRPRDIFMPQKRQRNTSNKEE